MSVFFNQFVLVRDWGQREHGEGRIGKLEDCEHLVEKVEIGHIYGRENG